MYVYKCIYRKINKCLDDSQLLREKETISIFEALEEA